MRKSVDVDAPDDAKCSHVIAECADWCDQAGGQRTLDRFSFQVLCWVSNLNLQNSDSVSSIQTSIHLLRLLFTAYQRGIEENVLLVVFRAIQCKNSSVVVMSRDTTGT